MTVVRQMIAVTITFRKSNKTYWRVGLALIVRVGKIITSYQHNTTEQQLEKKYCKSYSALKEYILVLFKVYIHSRSRGIALLFL
jgi:hypothetical protein